MQNRAETTIPAARYSKKTVQFWQQDYSGKCAVSNRSIRLLLLWRRRHESCALVSAVPEALSHDLCPSLKLPPTASLNYVDADVPVKREREKNSVHHSG